MCDEPPARMARAATGTGAARAARSSHVFARPTGVGVALLLAASGGTGRDADASAGDVGVPAEGGDAVSARATTLRSEPEGLASAALRAAGLGAIEAAEALEGAIDGPGRLFHAGSATVWVVTPARAAAEARGHQDAAAHPLRPRVLRRDERVVIFPRLGPAPDVGEALLSTLEAGTARRERVPLPSLLSMSDVRTDRALARAGLSRRAIDRLLAAAIDVESERGPSLGGVFPGWLRTDAETGRPVSLSMRGASADDWPARDLASLALRAGLDLREAHRARGGDPAARDRALDALLLREMLRELALGERDDELAAEAAALARALCEPVPERVRVTIDAPPAVDLARFLPLGDGVPASHARFLLRALDGLALAGGVVRVSTDPPLRAGRTRQSWEPRAERERRIDPRFSELRFDDEALYSATPRAIADALAEHAHGVVLDGTCGAGLLALALARRPEVREVVAVDVDRRRLAMARHNAEVHGLSDRIRFVHGDVREILAETKPDTLVLDPPWGGRDYDRARTTFDGLARAGLDVRPLLSAHAGTTLLKLPPSFDAAELPPGFVARVLFDERAIPKCLAAERR